MAPLLVTGSWCTSATKGEKVQMCLVWYLTWMVWGRASCTMKSCSLQGRSFSGCLHTPLQSCTQCRGPPPPPSNAWIALVSNHPALPHIWPNDKDPFEISTTPFYVEQWFKTWIIIYSKLKVRVGYFLIYTFLKNTLPTSTSLTVEIG